MKKIYDGDIPFHPAPHKKEQLSYNNGFYWWYEKKNEVGEWVGDSIQSKNPKWIKNLKFLAQLEIDSMSRGRSAANFTGVLHEVDGVEDSETRNFLEGSSVNIFMVDMLDIIKSNNIFKGKTQINVWFTFCKRGSNFGLALAPL